MSEKLKTLWDESPDATKLSVTDQQGVEAGSGQTGTSAEQNQQELTERAAAAEARELKAQLEAAEQRLADLTAETEASRASSMARPSAPGPASPEPPRYEPKASPGFLRRGSGNYRDPSATSQLLRQTTARRKARGRVILVAGLAVPLVALLIWGIVTMIQFAAKGPIPPSAETADTMAGPGSADGGLPPVQPETAALSLVPATGKLDLGGAVPLADEQDITAAQREIDRLSAVVEVSDAMVARLRDELAIARQAVETARQTTSAEANAEGETQQRELTLAVTASSARVATLQKELKAAQQQIADLSRAAEAAEDEAVRLREELAARQQEAAATQPPTAPSDQNPVADQKDPDQTQDAENVEAAPEIEEILTAAEISPDPVTSETDALRDTVSPDDLLLEPGHHVGREVVVIGSVVWLFQRYWLQSGSGHMRMLIDVEGLQLDDRNKLKNTVVQIEFLTQVRARITGTIERQGSENYHIAATELVFVE
jgi:exonuclease VII small subunit